MTKPMFQPGHRFFHALAPRNAKDQWWLFAPTQILFCGAMIKHFSGQ
jgi:hypothetical protein